MWDYKKKFPLIVGSLKMLLNNLKNCGKWLPSILLCFSDGSVVKNSPVNTCQCRGGGFDPSVSQILRRRKWQPTQYFCLENPKETPRLVPSIYMFSVNVASNSKWFWSWSTPSVWLPTPCESALNSAVVQQMRLNIQYSSSHSSEWVLRTEGKQSAFFKCRLHLTSFQTPSITILCHM